MQILASQLEGVEIVEPKLFAGACGIVLKSFYAERCAEVGLAATMVQDNLARPARRKRSTPIAAKQARPHPPGRDFRPSDRQSHRLAGVRPLNGRGVDRGRQAQAGFAQSFGAIERIGAGGLPAHAPDKPQCDRGGAWNNPEIGIPWLATARLFSKKETRRPRLADIPPGLSPRGTPIETALSGCK